MVVIIMLASASAWCGDGPNLLELKTGWAVSSRRAFLSLAELALVPQCARASKPQDSLIFKQSESGVKIADILIGNGAEVGPSSRVTVDVIGYLAGRQGWTFENSQQDDEPYRIELGKGTVIPGFEEGIQGMKVGGKRRIVVPSSLGYLDRSREPVPRDFGNRQRLYSTVLNDIRKDRERSNLGNDLAGIVVFDVKLIRIR